MAPDIQIYGCVFFPPLSKASEHEFADEHQIAPTDGGARDLPDMPRTNRRIRLGKRGMVQEIGRVYAEIERCTFPDRKRLMNRGVHHVHARSVDAVAPHVTKCSGRWGRVGAGVKPPVDAFEVTRTWIADQVWKPRESRCPYRGVAVVDKHERRERIASLEDVRSRERPAAERFVQRFALAQESLPVAKRKLIDAVRFEHIADIKVGGAIIRGRDIRVLPNRRSLLRAPTRGILVIEHM